MKEVFILMIGFLIFSCNRTGNESHKTSSKSQEFNQLTESPYWLLGKWKRLNEEEGKETFENWVKICETEYHGLGFTMQNGDTISQEKMQLTLVNSKWNLAVKLNQELESTVFKGVDYNESSFSCENKEIDFPNEIKYWMEGDKIYATVSNSEMKISFEFEKLQE